MNNIKKLYYGRIDVSEEIDVYRTSKSKECDVFYHWYFLNKGFNFQLYLCLYLLMGSMNPSNIVILKFKNAHYRCIIRGISKNEPIKLLQNTDLTEKSRTL